jgi:hypothetical protein
MIKEDEEVDESPARMADSTRPRSRSRSRSASKPWSTPRTRKGKESSIPALSILDILQSTSTGLPTDTFAQVAARPPSPKPTTPEKLIASATSELTNAVKKHQHNFLALLRSVSPGKSVSASKTNHLRAANIMLMSSATIWVEHAGGTHFSLKCLYELARTKEKEAVRIFNKEPLSDSLSINTKAKETATTMSSITDLDGFTTVSRLGGSSTSSPPKLCPQSRSPTRQGNKGGSRRNPFDDKFLTTFLPFLSRGITSKHTLTGIESDLKAYVNDPDSRQPTKKALCKDQSLLITAAQSSSSSASPVQISMYTKKRTALSSPAKGGLSLT